MRLLTFDQFEAAIPLLLEEAAAARGELHASRRLGDHGLGDNGPLSPVGYAVSALARVTPWVDRPLEPGPRYLAAEGWGDVRAEALAAVAQLLEALAAVRSTMPAAAAAARAASEREAIARVAFEVFAAPGGGVPVEGLEWADAIDHAGCSITGMCNPRLGPEIGLSLAHDELERSTGSAVCVLALIDARRAEAQR